LLSGIYSAIDRSQVSLLAVIDVSSAIHHEILLKRLELS